MIQRKEIKQITKKRRKTGDRQRYWISHQPPVKSDLKTAAEKERGQTIVFFFFFLHGQTIVKSYQIRFDYLTKHQTLESITFFTFQIRE